ncbi:ABC transporter permease [Cupriavidus sp. a3]|uniref:ABC transporter permease n=1 Tax=Cupriavidus sp. a3 TaxID=3242158 RepID=UPI003D9C5153
MLSIAITDLRESLSSWRLWSLLGWIEIRQRYARSAVGPFWLTISMAVMIASIGAVYGTLFGQELREYLPFLSVGLVMWFLLAQIVNEGSTVYIHSAHYIRQAATPKLLYVLQVVWRNLIILAHNFVIVIALLAIFGVKNWAVLPLFIPAFILFVLNAMWMAMIAGLLSARFRDLPQIIASLFQVAFYVTPIMYRPDSLVRFSWIVDLNPLSYLLHLVRGPLMGEVPTLLTWGVSAGMAAIGWAAAMWLTGRYLKRIPYWV